MAGVEALSKFLTGGSAAPAVQESRCASARVRRPICTACRDVCPVGALELSPSPRIAEACDGCGLCVAACPQEALSDDRKPAAPTGETIQFACPWRQRAPGPAAAQVTIVSCVGLLRLEDLLAPIAAGCRRLELDLSGCRDCPRASSLDRLRTAAAVCSRLSGCAIELIEESTERSSLPQPRRTVSRRGLFELLLGHVGRSLANRPAPNRARAHWAGLPDGRRRLLASLEALQPADAREAPVMDVAIDAGCDGCTACSALCPCGALTRTVEEGVVTLGFRAAACTGCSACVHACTAGFLRLAQAPSLEAALQDRTVPIAQVRQAACAACGMPFAPDTAADTFCPACRWRPRAVRLG